MSDNMLQVVMAFTASSHGPLDFDADDDMCIFVVVLARPLRFAHGQRKIRQCSNFCVCHISKLHSGPDKPRDRQSDVQIAQQMSLLVAKSADEQRMLAS